MQTDAFNITITESVPRPNPLSHQEINEWITRIKTDYTTATLSPVDRALCDHAAKLTRTPWLITESDISNLKTLGLSDRAIHDATQVIAYFNYINRIADGLHVDLEPEMAVTC